MCICSSYWIISSQEPSDLESDLPVRERKRAREPDWVEASQKGSARSLKSLQDEGGGQRTPVSSRKGPTLPRTLLCPPGRGLPKNPCHTQPVTERNHGRQGPSTNAAKISKRDSWVLRQVDSLYYPPSRDLCHRSPAW